MNGGSVRGDGTLPQRAEAIAALERCLAWVASLADESDRLICPEHRIEHTGKSACVAILAHELFRATGRAAHRELAVRQGRRLVARLEREGTSPCHTFRPGRHDPYNCSNSVIDGGACSDALASLVLDPDVALGVDDRAAFAHAATLHADTYLKYACRDKGVPAQRTWALTGLAAAHALEPRAEWKQAGREALALIDGVQHADGSFPYHPLVWGAGHPGASDVSCFYQSRVTGFELYALAGLGLDPRERTSSSRLVRGLAFLAALHGPDGIKCGLLEAKPWYWGANYEVASHPFDVHALASGFAAFEHFEIDRGDGDLGDIHSAASSSIAAHWSQPATWARAALAAFAAWADHLEADGRPMSHRPGPGRSASYQCPLFWAAHACWAARVLPLWDRLVDAAADASEPRGVSWFADAQLARFDGDGVHAWIRGARPPGNAMHGSPCGNGPIRVLTAAPGGGYDERVPRCRLGGANRAEWNGRAGRVDLGRGWRAGAGDLRFSLWLARVAARRGDLIGAALEPLRHLSRDVLAFAHPRVSSGFARDVAAQVRRDELTLESALAWRDGGAVPGSRVRRRYQLTHGALSVVEELAAAGSARRIEWTQPGPGTSAPEPASEEGERRWRVG